MSTMKPLSLEELLESLKIVVPEVCFNDVKIRVENFASTNVPQNTPEVNVIVRDGQITAAFTHGAMIDLNVFDFDSAESLEYDIPGFRGKFENQLEGLQKDAVWSGVWNAANAFYDQLNDEEPQIESVLFESDERSVQPEPEALLFAEHKNGSHESEPAKSLYGVGDINGINSTNRRW